MKKRKRHSPEQVVKKLRDADVECPQKLIHRYEGSDWVTNFAVGSFCGGSAANGTEAAHCEANSAGVGGVTFFLYFRFEYVAAF